MVLFVSFLLLFNIRRKLLPLDAAEILETRTVDGSDQQEYFVHYLNCESAPISPFFWH